MSLGKRSVLITGASRGLGRALAVNLASAGHRVLLLARQAEALEAAVSAAKAAALASGLGGSAQPIVADIGGFAPGRREQEHFAPGRREQERHGAARVAGLAQALIGPIDTLIHNASALGVTPLQNLTEVSIESVEQVYRVNVLGPLALTQALVGNFVLRGRGLVVGVSSDAAVEAYAGWGAYGSSKAAFDQLLRILAAELSGTGVDVLSVDPGEMDTDMHQAALPDADRSTLQRPEQVAARIAGLLSSPLRVPSGTRLTAQALADLDLEAA